MRVRHQSFLCKCWGLKRAPNRTSWCADSWSIAHIRNDEEGLDKRAQGIDDVSEHLGGVLLHVVRLAEWTRAREKKTTFKISINAEQFLKLFFFFFLKNKNCCRKNDRQWNDNWNVNLTVINVAAHTAYVPTLPPQLWATEAFPHPETLPAETGRSHTLLPWG